MLAERELWTGCVACLNPRHPGPCAKPGSKAYEKRHGRGSAGPAGGGGGSGGEPLTGSDAYKSVPSGYSQSQGLRPRPKGMTREQIDDAETSLRIYQGSSSGPIQDHLRGGGLQGPRNYGRQADDIRTAMDHSRLEQDIVVFRGVRRPETTFAGMGGRYRDDMTGTILTEKGFLSTSTKRSIAADFADQHPVGDGVLMEIRLPKGTGAIRLAGARENEILGQSGLRLTVVEDRGVVDGLRHLVLEAQP